MIYHISKSGLFYLLLSLFQSTSCFASSAKGKFIEISKTSYIDTLIPDTIFQDSDLKIVIEHHLQKHFELRGNTISIGPESSEMAASFNDPSRALYRHTSISMDNDQANGIIYRGLPSHLSKWSIFGAEIVNPNHLSNAGTFNDQASTSAGGVLAVPFEVINRFEFNAGPQDPDDIISMSGNMDFDFNRDSKRFIKLGLLGLEALYQSPNKSKFKVHGRYSTVGLLSDLGVNFDGESIDFQDVFLQFNLTENLQFFSILGSSNNVHQSVLDSTLVESIKDIQTIDFHSILSIQGLNYRTNNSNHSLVFSYKKDEWSTAVPEVYKEFSYTNASTDQLNRLISYKGEHQLGHNLDKGLFKLALNSAFRKNKLTVFDRRYDDSYLSIDPSVSWSKIFNKLGGIRWHSGLGLAYDTHHKGIDFNPGFSIQWASQGHILEINSSYFSHRQDPLILGDREISQNDNKPYLEPSRSWASAISWKLVNTDNQLSFLVRLFSTELSNLPIDENYSPVMNSIEYMNQSKLTTEGKARTRGIELMVDKSIGDNSYVNFNTSYFNAEYLNKNNVWLNSQFNFRHVTNINFSHKIDNQKGNKWSFNLGGHLRGGAFSNTDAIPLFKQEHLGLYWRVDFRIEFSRKKSKWVLDIQNILNRENDAYYFLDIWTNTEKLKKQLGLIPVLSYKRFF